MRNKVYQKITNNKKIKNNRLVLYKNAKNNNRYIIFNRDKDLTNSSKDNQLLINQTTINSNRLNDISEFNQNNKAQYFTKTKEEIFKRNNHTQIDNHDESLNNSTTDKVNNIPLD